MTPQQPVAEAQRSTSPPSGTVLTPGSMEVNSMHPYVGGRIRKPAEWYAALISNASDNADELARIRAVITADDELPGDDAQKLLQRVDALLPNASQEPAPATELHATARRLGWIKDTTIDRPPQTYVTFFKRKPGGAG
jgi:hypothetical protein